MGKQRAEATHNNVKLNGRRCEVDIHDAQEHSNQRDVLQREEGVRDTAAVVARQKGTNVRIEHQNAAPARNFDVRVVLDIRLKPTAVKVPQRVHHGQQDKEE